MKSDTVIGGKTELWSPSTFQMTNSESALSNKVVMLYFSAHWCMPCQRFTLTLQSFYQRLKSKNGTEGFEIVFCSMDRSVTEYQAYIRTMPWLCLPFRHPQIGTLLKQYGVLGIPHLVILDKCGKVLVADGVKEVNRDPQGIQFPWRPKPIVQLLPVCYQQNDRTMSSISKLADKHLMLFFAASWCNVSRDFTPKLSKAYAALQKIRNDFELLYVSLDKDKMSFDVFFKEMSFCSLPYQEKDIQDELLTRFAIKSLPTVVILSPCPSDGGDRVVINSNVRSVIENGDYISDFPFHPKHFGDLNTTSDNILQRRCLIVFHEAGDDCEQEDIQEAVKLAAHELQNSEHSLKLYWAFEPMGFAQNIRDALQLPTQNDPLMVLLDIQNDGAYYISKNADVTLENIINFIRDPGVRLKLH